MNKEDFDKQIRMVTTPLPGDKPEKVFYKLSVKSKYDNYNIVDFFCEVVPRSNNETWLKKINDNNLKVNNQNINPNYLVKAGDVATHYSEPKTEPPINPNIELIYADDDFWVINKPSPLPMHASGRFVRNTLINILELAFPNEEFKMVHRIDANTTGLVVIAKNKTSANSLRIQFEQKKVRKEYFALVEGVIEENESSSNQPIGSETIIGGARKLSHLGQAANTEIKTLERRESSTLLRVEPLTGRTNQIRLHLAEMGYPIVGDLGYSDKNYFKNNPFTYPEDSLYLHAHKIKFTHPTSLDEVIFEAPIPQKFKFS